MIFELIFTFFLLAIKIASKLIFDYIIYANIIYWIKYINHFDPITRRSNIKLLIITYMCETKLRRLSPQIESKKKVCQKQTPQLFFSIKDYNILT